MTGYRILAVDDDPAVLEALAELLQVDGYVVERASCVDEALEMVAASHFDLVISDLVMPGRCGLELIRALRTDHPGLATLLITGQAQLSTKLEVTKAGAVDFLTKPIDVSRLRSILDQLLPRSPATRRKPRSRLNLIHPTRKDHGVIQISIGTRMREIEREVIATTLKAMGWNRNRTAEVLGISRRSLYSKLESYGIGIPELRLAPKEQPPLRAKGW